MKSLLKFSKLSLNEAQEAFTLPEIDPKHLKNCVEQLLVLLEKDIVDTVPDQLEDQNIIYFVAGYCARSIGKLFQNSDDVKKSLTYLCSSGHNFCQIFRKLVKKLFNIMAKNYISEINSKIHSGKKRKDSLNTTSRKVLKLQSEQK